MQLTLIYHAFSFRHRWTIRHDGLSIPVRLSGYRWHWEWPSGGSYRIDMSGQITIARDGVEVARRERPTFEHHRGWWRGTLPLTYIVRCRSIWFRGVDGKLVLFCRPRILPGAHRIVIRSTVDEEAVPLLCGIAMATFVNFDG